MLMLCPKHKIPDRLPKGIDCFALYTRCLAIQLVIIPGVLFTVSKRY